jgi:hypothetical protein
MVVCESTIQWGLLFLILGGMGFGVFMKNIKVGAIAGGLGAVIFILGLLGVGC